MLRKTVSLKNKLDKCFKNNPNEGCKIDGKNYTSEEIVKTRGKVRQVIERMRQYMKQKKERQRVRAKKEREN